MGITRVKSSTPGFRKLKKLDHGSQEFRDQLKLILDDHDSIPDLDEKGAILAIECLYRASRVPDLDAHLKKETLTLLLSLCSRYEMLPASCSISGDLVIIDDSPVATRRYADVRRGTLDGRQVLVKIPRKSSAPDRAEAQKKQRLFRDAILCHTLPHPNIQQLVGVCNPSKHLPLVFVFPWTQNANIVKHTREHPSTRWTLLADATRGLQYLHKAGCIHGSLNAASIVVTDDEPPRARLAEFGLSSILGDPSTDGVDVCGRTSFMAPELLCPEKFGFETAVTSQESDVYALSMVIFEVVTSVIPFHTLRDTQIALKIIEGVRPDKPANAVELGLTDGIWNLIESCWQEDYTKRPSVDVVLESLERAAESSGTVEDDNSDDLEEEFDFDLDELSTALPDGLFATGDATSPTFGSSRNISLVCATQGDQVRADNPIESPYSDGPTPISAISAFYSNSRGAFSTRTSLDNASKFAD